jgi:hypothetical protein
LPASRGFEGAFRLHGRAGIPWLLANLALASFIKFNQSAMTAIAVTAIMGVAALYFFFAHFRWMRYVTGSGADPQTRTLKARGRTCPSPSRQRLL